MGTEDLMGVEQGFDQHHIPVDAFYLDLHHIGEEMRFFTWSEKLFPDPGTLLEHLHENHRWLLTI
jgi:alpha-glucosidase (family GH31 glycosyl hydrolase)